MTHAFPTRLASDLVKIGRRPFAYSMLLVGGDVGSINTAERRVERYAAGKRRAISGGMAGGAVGGAHQVLAARQQLRRRCRFIDRSEEHTSELQSLMRSSYAVFCLKKKNK